MNTGQVFSAMLGAHFKQQNSPKKKAPKNGKNNALHRLQQGHLFSVREMTQEDSVTI